MGVPSRTSAPTPAHDRTFGYSDHPREGAPTFTPPHRGSSTGSDHCSRTHLVYVSHGGVKNHSYSVSALDPDTGIVSVIPMPAAQSHLALDPISNTLFTGNYTDNSVSAVDLSTRTVVTTLGVGNNPANIVFDSKGRRLYVANMYDNSISVIEPAH